MARNCLPGKCSRRDAKLHFWRFTTSIHHIVKIGTCVTHFFDNVHGHIYDFIWRSDRKFNVKLGKLATETVEMLKQDYGHEAKGKVM